MLARTSESLFEPHAVVMSNLRLAQMAEAAGDQAQARRRYRAFLDSWGAGDVEREAVEHARGFLAES